MVPTESVYAEMSLTCTDKLLSVSTFNNFLSPMLSKIYFPDPKYTDTAESVDTWA